jgi:pseudaminic acid biosynthesis-associated methylase
MKKTEQVQEWSGEFGKQYTDRNFMTLDEMENLWIGNYGFSRKHMNEKFLKDIPLDARILEVGSNIGNQLLCLQKAGFTNMYGIELQSYAVEISKSRTKNINIIEGSAFDIPYKDGYFDIVFTSGVLVHIAPQDIDNVLDEIYRCSKRFIWGAEYYYDQYINVPYREKNALMWKGNFSKMYLERFNKLYLVKEEFMKYLKNDNVDVMYLLEKTK